METMIVLVICVGATALVARRFSRIWRGEEGCQCGTGRCRATSPPLVESGRDGAGAPRDDSIDALKRIDVSATLEHASELSDTCQDNTSRAGDGPNLYDEMNGGIPTASVCDPPEPPMPPEEEADSIRNIDTSDFDHPSPFGRVPLLVCCFLSLGQLSAGEDRPNQSMADTPPTTTPPALHVFLDVNADGNLDGAIDGAENFMPGYLGKTCVLYDARHGYCPQGTKLVVCNVPQDVPWVGFKIVYATAFRGYCGNASDPAVSGPDRDDDYSFRPRVNARGPDIVKTKNGRAEIDLWCKDFGGFARIAVRLLDGDKNVLRAIQVKVPEDGELFPAATEGIPRMWKDGHFGRWDESTQTWAGGVWEKVYGNSPDTCADRLASRIMGLDHEPAGGDGFTVRQEYRGFIIRGVEQDEDGGCDLRHVRLNPVRKESAMEMGIQNLREEKRARWKTALKQGQPK